MIYYNKNPLGGNKVSDIISDFIGDNHLEKYIRSYGSLYNPLTGKTAHDRVVTFPENIKAMANDIIIENVKRLTFTFIINNHETFLINNLSFLNSEYETMFYIPIDYIYDLRFLKYIKLSIK